MLLLSMSGFENGLLSSVPWWISYLDPKKSLPVAKEKGERDAELRALTLAGLAKTALMGLGFFCSFASNSKLAASF